MNDRVGRLLVLEPQNNSLERTGDSAPFASEYQDEHSFDGLCGCDPRPLSSQPLCGFPGNHYSQHDLVSAILGSLHLPSAVGCKASSSHGSNPGQQ